MGNYGFELPGLLPTKSSPEVFHPGTDQADSVRFDETGSHRSGTAPSDLRVIRLPTA